MAPARCGEGCNFRLCRSNEFLAALPVGARLRPGVPGFATQPFVCSLSNPNQKVRTGEPMVQMDDGNFVQMKSWSAPTTNFARKFFRSKTIQTLQFSGITFKPPTANQWSLLDDRCIKLPITRVGSTRLPRNAANCVGFRMTNPKVQVTVFWRTDDDIDMTVVEPDTETVSAGSPTTGGVHQGNNNFDSCGKVVIGKEIVTYATDCDPGTYCVKLRMRNKCSPPRRAKYTITVAVNGVEIARKNGSSFAMSGVFETFCYTI